MIVAVIFIGIIGLAIGSFLNVVVYRVPAGKSVVSPPSACPQCERPIRHRDNIPVASWLVLRGRCRDCGAKISPRYPLVESATGLAFLGVSLIIGLRWELPAFLYLAAITIALALIDVDTRRLPNAIVLPSYPVAGVLLCGAALFNGEAERIPRILLAALAAYAFFLLVRVGGALVFGRTAMGGGDVKLAGVLGLYLGWFSWQALVVGIFLGFLIGALVGIAEILGHSGGLRSGMQQKIPYGPSLLAGTWLAFVFAAPLSDWYFRLAGLS